MAVGLVGYSALSNDAREHHSNGSANFVVAPRWYVYESRV